MASEFELFSTAAAIYAESLLDLAVKAGQTEAVAAEMADLRDLWHREPGFAKIMCSAAIDVAARRDTINRLFTGRVGPLVLHFLLVLNARRRAMILPHVCDAFRKKLDAVTNRSIVQVTSAAPLDDSQRKQIALQVQRLTGHEADLVEHLDPSILAGLCLQIGDRVYDFSARRRIRDFRRSLADSVERSLVSGSSRFVTEG